MHKILITSKVYPDSFNLLPEKFELIMPEQGDFTKQEIIEKISDCEVLISMFTIKIDKDIIEAGKNLKMISNYGAGFNNIDIDCANDRGIVVTNTPDPVTEPTAELAFGLMHTLCRRIIELNNDIRTPGKIKWGLMQNIGSTLIDKTLGIIGFGRIGQALARRAVNAKMNIIYYNRNRVREDIENLYSAKYLTKDEVISQADYLSLHVPLTKETTHLIDKEELHLMKKNAYLINTSRGAVINEHELAKALHDKVIAGAGIDVFEKEPTIDPLLLTAENAILVPHIGTATRETRQSTAIMACQNILGFYADRKNIHRCGKW